MNNNQLGRNIQHLRKIYNETLDDLGNVIHCAKSTVKGYENGSRSPDLHTLQLLAVHYNIAVDELLNADLTDLENISIDLNSSCCRAELIKLIFPLYSSQDALENLSFKKGYELSQELLVGFSNNEILVGNMIVRIFEAFSTAANEINSFEAVANLLWTIFVWWSQIQDTNQILSLHNKSLSKKLSFKDWMALKDMEDASIAEKRASFIADFNVLINDAIKILKSDQEWSDLADYYLALRYVVGMVDTGLSSEMNLAIGEQMMISFMSLGNSQALTFYKTFCLPN